jgi:8-oxo-dGTP pyrophosphatase MutT (NUDIX family)
MRQAIQKTCSNCGLYGHSFRHCISPVTSHGVIVFKVDGTWNPAKILSEQESAITGFEGVGHVKYLMIQRRDSLGFVELMRGKYQTDDFRYITTQLKGMTKKERNRFLTLSFNELWSQLWGIDSTSTQYRSEKEISRQKFESLRVNGVLDESENRKTLGEVFEQMGPGWETPEYGFPKGRRDPNETERDCALRELWEETGLRKEDIKVIENCEPLQETFFGSNRVHYCHKYVLAYIKPDVEVSFDPANEHMKREIGDLGWFTLEEGLEKIRPENVEKKEVLLRAQSLLRNYCPLMLG